MRTPIHHTFAPHVDGPYLRQSLSLLARPWTWRDGDAARGLAEALAHRFGGEAHLYASGREALLVVLRSLALQPGDEVIVQSYTCVAVPNAVTAAGGTPVYADIEREHLNLTTETVRERLTKHTRAVICQHTFGLPADTAALRALCDAENLILIEDCAHVMPDDAGPGDIGRRGDYLVFSFGRDKAISGIAGGGLIARKPLRGATAGASLPLHVIARLLLYPLLYAAARPMYGPYVGKALLALARNVRLLLPITTNNEKLGTMDSALHRIPNACAALALRHYGKLRRINDHRRMLTALYLDTCAEKSIPVPSGIRADLPLQKFPIFLRNAGTVRTALKERNMHLDDGWTGCVICPQGVDLDPTHYVPGSDPMAEAACEQILSLPTHPTMSAAQARRLMDALGELLSSM